jgi:hypothetical protein
MVLRKTGLIFAGWALCSAAVGQTAGSNIALSDYPGPACTRPQKPVLPMSADHSKEAAPFSGSRVARQETIPAGDAGLSHTGTPDADIVVNSEGDKRSYNDKVEQYNKDLLAYNAGIVQFNSCIKAYMDNGNADLMRVQQKLNAVAAAVNAH